MIRREQFFENCKPALIIAVKQIKTIDADTMHQVRQYALKAVDEGEARLSGAFAPRAFATVALAA